MCAVLCMAFLMVGCNKKDELEATAKYETYCTLVDEHFTEPMREEGTASAPYAQVRALKASVAEWTATHAVSWMADFSGNDPDKALANDDMAARQRLAALIRAFQEWKAQNFTPAAGRKAYGVCNFVLTYELGVTRDLGVNSVADPVRVTLEYSNME